MSDRQQQKHVSAGTVSRDMIAAHGSHWPACCAHVFGLTLCYWLTLLVPGRISDVLEVFLMF